ncbi:MAG: precorrin-4 C(11)-methyltransferase [Desulfobacteraceae bacterium]
MNEVLFVGAGPGDPELITVKGQRAVMEADVVIYTGSLVPGQVLTWAKSGAEKIDSASMTLEQIIQTIREAWEKKGRVVRLHTGDPSLYGAVYEQMAELSKLSIPFSVIPGITAAFAAAASMKIEYTLPEVSQTLILTRMAGRTPVPELENLASLASHQASMAVYLSISLVDEVASVLSRHYGEDAVCAVAYKVSQPEEKVVYTPVSALPETVKKENIASQALIIISKVLGTGFDSLRYKSRLYDRDFSHQYRNAEG